MLDIAIIGGGPAGLSAAITAVMRNKKVKLFGNPQHTSFIYKAERINNYIGLPNVTGKEMIEQFTRHAIELGVPIQEAKVIEIFSMGKSYMLNVENEFIEAKTVILANGITKNAQLEGESEFVGKGVSYCATCDGPLYKGKTVAVIGDSPHAEEEVNYLSEICAKVYYIPLYKEIKRINENVEVLRSKPTKIIGDKKVSQLQLEQETIDVNCVFIIKESIPTSQLLKGLETDGASIKVNRFMETNLPGVFAAGDCTGKPFQVAKAVGEGNTAVLQAISYLNTLG